MGARRRCRGGDVAPTRLARMAGAIHHFASFPLACEALLRGVAVSPAARGVIALGACRVVPLGALRAMLPGIHPGLPVRSILRVSGVSGEFCWGRAFVKGGDNAYTGDDVPWRLRGGGFLFHYIK